MSLLPPFTTPIDRAVVAHCFESRCSDLKIHRAQRTFTSLSIADGRIGDMHRIGFIAPRRFQMMRLAALTVFEIANMTHGAQNYEVHVLSEHGGLVDSSSGMKLETEAFGDTAFDTLIVGSITEMKIPLPDSAVLDFVKEASKASRRMTSICSGAFVLAEAGLLDGRRATMHWAHAAEFRSRFPNVVTQEDRIFINDGPMWTSVGMTAGIDLALACSQSFGTGRVGKQPFTELTHREMRYDSERFHRMSVDDKTRHFVVFIRNQRFIEEGAQGNRRQRQLRGRPLFLRRSGDTGEFVAGSAWARFGEQGFEVIETICPNPDGFLADHLMSSLKRRCRRLS